MTDAVFVSSARYAELFDALLFRSHGGETREPIALVAALRWLPQGSTRRCTGYRTFASVSSAGRYGDLSITAMNGLWRMAPSGPMHIAGFCRAMHFNENVKRTRLAATERTRH